MRSSTRSFSTTQMRLHAPSWEQIDARYAALRRAGHRSREVVVQVGPVLNGSDLSHVAPYNRAVQQLPAHLGQRRQGTRVRIWSGRWAFSASSHIRRLLTDARAHYPGPKGRLVRGSRRCSPASSLLNSNPRARVSHCV